MTAREEHPELVVVQRRALEVVVEVEAHGLGQLGGTGGGDALVAQPVERLAPRRRGQPGARPLRDAAAVPVDRGRDERVLDDVLGQRQVAVQPPHDRSQHRGALVAERPLERARRAAHASSYPVIGRTSFDPYSALGIFAAHAVAASRSSTSMM
jgi:hypothetical protein